MVLSIPVTCIIQLNHEEGFLISESEVYYRELSIKILSQETLDSSLLKYTILLKNGSEEKIVSLFWISDWLDENPPSHESAFNQLLDSIHQMTEENPLMQPIVFCKAGIGRTGTFLAAYLIKHLLKWSLINHKIEMGFLEFQVILFLRLYRHRAVRTIQQVKFLMSYTNKLLA
jgi:protein tyrosine phosphatase